MAIGQKRAIIIGAGPAGLTAAYELLTRTGSSPIVLEKSDYMGGISRTVNYKGNRIDIGGHRFFSKSDRVMEWWLQMLPLQASENSPAAIRYHRMERPIAPSAVGPDPAAADRVMLLRPRKSRIYYLRRFFDYPISLSKDTLAQARPVADLQDRCQLRAERAVSPQAGEDPGAVLHQPLRPGTVPHVFQVLHGEGLGRAVRPDQRRMGRAAHQGPVDLVNAAFTPSRRCSRAAAATSGRRTRETSLIEQFLYPKFGPGQMWEEVARRIREMGGEIRTGLPRGADCHRWLARHGGRGRRTLPRDDRETFAGDYFFSTAPVQELMRSFDVAPPDNVLEVSRRPGLPRLHHRRPAGALAPNPRRDAAGQEADPRQLDLHPGTRRAAGQAPDLQ